MSEEVDDTEEDLDYWNYRVIEFHNKEKGYKWRALHEVYYKNGKPCGHTEDPATLEWDADEEIDIDWILKSIKSAFEKPVLLESDFHDTPQS